MASNLVKFSINSLGFKELKDTITETKDFTDQTLAKLTKSVNELFQRIEKVRCAELNELYCSLSKFQKKLCHKKDQTETEQIKKQMHYVLEKISGVEKILLAKVSKELFFMEFPDFDMTEEDLEIDEGTRKAPNFLSWSMSDGSHLMNLFSIYLSIRSIKAAQGLIPLFPLIATRKRLSLEVAQETLITSKKLDDNQKVSPFFSFLRPNL